MVATRALSEVSNQSDGEASLRRCVRDLVALSSLPALWIKADASQIADSIGQLAVSILDAELACVFLRDPAFEAVLRHERARGRSIDLGRVRGLYRANAMFELDDAYQDRLRATCVPIGRDPESGIIASANQNPFSENFSYTVNGGFAPPYRAREIRTLLSQREKWRPKEMLGIQKDVYSSYLYFIAQQAVQAWDKHPNSNAQMRAAADELRKWNGQTEKGTAAPMIVTLLDTELRKNAAKAAAPGAESEYAARMAPVVIERLLRERPQGWFNNYDELLVNSLATAVEAGQKMQGSNVSAWDYGQWIELKLTHPVAGQLPLIGRYFNIGPVPMSGSSTSIKQTTQRLGPSLRMVIDLANLDQSQANIVTGESGNVLSRHYKDQWGAYYGGTSFPMQFDKVEAKETLVVNPQ